MLHEGVLMTESPAAASSFVRTQLSPSPLLSSLLPPERAQGAVRESERCGWTEEMIAPGAAPPWSSTCPAVKTKGLSRLLVCIGLETLQPF